MDLVRRGKSGRHQPAASKIPSYGDGVSVKPAKSPLTESRRILRPVGKPPIRVSRLAQAFTGMDAERRAMMVHWTYAMIFLPDFQPKDQVPRYIVRILDRLMTRFGRLTGANGASQVFAKVVRYAISHQKEIEDGEQPPAACLTYLTAAAGRMERDRSGVSAATKRSASRRLRNSDTGT